MNEQGEVVQWCNHAKTESKTVSYSIPELDSDIMDQGDCFHYKYDKLGSHPYSIVEINGLSTRKVCSASLFYLLNEYEDQWSGQSHSSRETGRPYIEIQ